MLQLTAAMEGNKMVKWRKTDLMAQKCTPHIELNCLFPLKSQHQVHLWIAQCSSVRAETWHLLRGIGLECCWKHLGKATLNLLRRWRWKWSALKNTVIVNDILAQVSLFLNWLTLCSGKAAMKTMNTNLLPNSTEDHQLYAFLKDPVRGFARRLKNFL